MRTILAVSTVSIILAATACKTADKGGGEQGAVPAITVGVAELVGDYKANEVRGDTKYKGKRVQVTGIVGDIKKNMFDSIYVTLGTGAQFELENMHANFPKALEAQAAALDKGVTITVDCKITGKVVTIVNGDDCKFASAPPAAKAAGSTAASGEGSGAVVSAKDTCTKLEAAGVAKTCVASDTGATFEIVGLVGKKGNVVAQKDEAVFKKYLASVEAQPPTSPLRPFFSSDKANVVVHLTKGVTPAIEAKTKAVVDAL